MDLDLPAILPDLDELMQKYCLNPKNLPIHNAKQTCNFLGKAPNPINLLCPTVNPLTTRMEVARDPASGHISGIREDFHSSSGSTAKNSFSLRRIPGPPSESVRGSSMNYPFWPGGINEPSIEKTELEQSELFDSRYYLTKHPLLSGCMKLSDSVKHDSHTDSVKKLEGLDAAKILSMDGILTNLLSSKVEGEKSTVKELVEEEELIEEISVQESSIPPGTQTVIKLEANSDPNRFLPQETDWAEVVNTSSTVDDFHTRVPNPACSYPFELDTFQKQAIMYMENKESVFVAAHTSAGKTVVAEYAIALSLKHLTRSFYTSPIKALSNQKYRELKMKFEDVGLLTGDIQINTKASCLIMTTEILQSMLYNGSDLVRDLEWVIFDEVHYINNAERGHVWEEVLIMLPAHIRIVLLSATVPNTLEFADWIGRIKKKKIYVISTTKRPVPLEHYLYTGSGGKSKDERFLLVDSNGKLINQGYYDATNAKKQREKKSKQMQGPKGNRHMLTDNQEKTMWIGLVDHLRKNDLLPVVAFTLSKNRCNVNASLLESQDLTTAREKGEIHAFIKKCTDKLQGSDKELPQVVEMRELLKKGIGVHHSGILPILKEVVEMLFAKGLVKLLFATETFAMGVNMPARSVIFDSIRKHDGMSFRDLLPSEYIQMAGRAGRRGIDTIGTVIILCKQDIPELSDLHKMMLGKPTKLESQFKLTYAMILNLLRVEALRVEDMMRRSFSESLQLANQSKYEDDLRHFEKLLDEEKDLECVSCCDIQDFYGLSKDYIQDRYHTNQNVFSQANSRKYISPGRIVTISHKTYQNYIACIVKLDRDPKKLSVFVLESKTNDVEQAVAECLAVTKTSYYSIIPTNDHGILQINIGEITGISKKFLKIDGDKIIDNVQKRLIPRFQDDPPSKSVLDLIREIQRIYEAGTDQLLFMDFVKDLLVKDLTCMEDVMQLRHLRDRINSLSCLECPQFNEHFVVSFHKLQLREKVGRLKYLVSEESLMLHPEYQKRIQVLKSLNYLQHNNIVTLKGRVACEMGNHELMVTELLLENVLAEKPIEEACALLSSLVFQQRNCSEPSLTSQLQDGVKEFKLVAEKIGQTQRDCGLAQPVGDFVDQFNFGLAEVVYQWCRGMSFISIMELTDVQEGITVKAIQRLDETLRDVRNAARIIGNPSLYEKMEQASACIKRDIVFAASLYTQ